MAPLAELIGPNKEALLSKSFFGDVKIERNEGVAQIHTNTLDGFLAVVSLDPTESQEVHFTSDKNGNVYDGRYPTSSAVIESGAPREVVHGDRPETVTIK